MEYISSRKRFAVGNLEDYEPTRRLGKGGFGSVVMARHRVTGHAVAIKRLACPGRGQSAVMREKSFLEACSSNPFVVRFHGVLRALDSKELRLLMEHVEGPNLRDVIGRRRAGEPPLPEATVRAIMWQLLQGAKKMHAIHVVHRDIKPENILFDINRSLVKICDFGIALRMSDAPPYTQAGTRWYMAPEVLLGKPDYDTLVDTWALGCIMAELIDGEVIFQGVCSEDQLCCMTDVLGVPDDETWPWFSSTPFATTLLPEQPYVQRDDLLRKRFPETMLSEEGFEVLSGLLTWNPDRRLTASAALKYPWFADLNAPPVPATKKGNLASALPNKMMDPPVAPPTNSHKRRKMQ